MKDAFSSEDSPPPPIPRILEAMLFVGGALLNYPRVCEVLRGLTAEQLTQAVAQLNQEYQEQARPYRVHKREEGYELAIRPQFFSVQERLQGARRETRLSSVALDTLSLVAYHQPVTRQQVDSLRGGDSLTALRQLVRLGLIAIQRGQAQQKEVQYVTTSRFLRLFGLKNLEDLPRPQDVQRI